MANAGADTERQKSVLVDGRFTNPWPTWKWPTYFNMVKFLLEKSNSNIPSKEEVLLFSYGLNYDL